MLWVATAAVLLLFLALGLVRLMNLFANRLTEAMHPYSTDTSSLVSHFVHIHILSYLIALHMHLHTNTTTISTTPMRDDLAVDRSSAPTCPRFQIHFISLWLWLLLRLPLSRPVLVSCSIGLIQTHFRLVSGIPDEDT